MNKQINLEDRRKRIETLVKILGLAGVCLVLGPVYLIMMHGLAALTALGVAALFGFTAVQFLPVLSVQIANWRLKALKAVAAANPIETLENQYRQKQEALAVNLDSIKKFYCVIQELYKQIQEHDEAYPNKPSQFKDKYDKMVQLLEVRKYNYKKAKASLVSFGELLDEKRSDWKVACLLAKANQLAAVGEEFQTKLLQDTALSTIQDGLNMAFSELETSLLEDVPQPSISVTVKPQTQITDKGSRHEPALDLEAEFAEEPVAASRKK
jgi:hypothetical protein